VFERYTERARRTLFFARYEASGLGGSAIETEHLLLGLIREGKGLTSSVFAEAQVSLDVVRREIRKRVPVREKLPTTVETPFSMDVQHTLRVAAEEASRLGHSYIGTEHLLLGILAGPRSLAASLLIEKGIQADVIREHIIRLTKRSGKPEEAD
jgi:ATP-dependent Clp protease ATP-binding subunit ClpC